MNEKRKKIQLIRNGENQKTPSVMEQGREQEQVHTYVGMHERKGESRLPATSAIAGGWSETHPPVIDLIKRFCPQTSHFIHISTELL